MKEYSKVPPEIILRLLKEVLYEIGSGVWFTPYTTPSTFREILASRPLADYFSFERVNSIEQELLALVKHNFATSQFTLTAYGVNTAAEFVLALENPDEETIVNLLTIGGEYEKLKNLYPDGIKTLLKYGKKNE